MKRSTQPLLDSQYGNQVTATSIGLGYPLCYLVKTAVLPIGGTSPAGSHCIDKLTRL